MSVANPLWGAPRIHGELLKLGMDVGQTTVAKYMAKRRRPPSRHLRHVLASYQKYNEVRTHLSLQKDAPVRRDVCRTGRVRSSPILGGLHHQYVRV
jgi:hypothetical protein